MHLSLLNMRTRLKPLVWLLLAAVMSSFSPHLAQGIVLCIGENHVAVESVQSAHHDNPLSEYRTQANAFESGELQPTNVQHVSDNRTSCTDVPIWMSRAGDTCHQAIQVDTRGADARFVVQSVLTVDLDPPARSTHTAFSSDEPASSSRHPHSTVVLLI